jgi:hypothetical protein
MKSLEELADLSTVEEAALFLRIGRGMAYRAARRYLDTDGKAGLPVSQLAGSSGCRRCFSPASSRASCPRRALSPVALINAAPVDTARRHPASCTRPAIGTVTMRANRSNMTGLTERQTIAHIVRRRALSTPARWPGDGAVTSLRGAAVGEYYVSEVGSYYVAAEEPRGRWFGDAAARLGPSREIDDEAFVSLLSGVDPSARVPLGRAFGEESVRCYDVTFSAPKSVSALVSVADPATRAEVHAAVDAVLGYVERHALTRFRVEGEVVSVDAEGDR